VEALPDVDEDAVAPPPPLEPPQADRPAAIAAVVTTATIECLMCPSPC
jgi:hypothetical protein